MRIDYSSRFKRSFNKLPADLQNDFDQKIKIFFNNSFNPSLKTHKLRGNLASYYAFYLRDGYRVLFEFEDDNNILLVNIGGHNDYSKWSKR
ncbi:type II toxin-antitoxin system mRNA interferase toxin, RelE/StbE family [Candidatus Peregrinibacteria bacterium CG08_land_8_20_14_0_20_41_10]|nr:MAG: hypothetical protein AUJ78_01495 [Candidatus Peregrinibacteria bacterium CG1_02_41_10]PIS32037.1 MAG: type II toxin-antitoxin system mRNA interferase toxin, RelE/StbE family [Candidatus Peregrinibacteria bacterium CG08_land_8_20_14_0_20_41_10]